MTTKTKSKPSKAEAIREALRKNINASAKEVQEHAAKYGYDIAPAQISNIRTSLKGGGASGKRRNGTVTAEELIAARAMADKVGGVTRARELLGIITRLN